MSTVPKKVEERIRSFLKQFTPVLQAQRDRVPIEFDGEVDVSASDRSSSAKRSRARRPRTPTKRQAALSTPRSPHKTVTTP